MISLENLSFLLGVLVFCGETIIPKGTRGSQLSFKFTIRFFGKEAKKNELAKHDKGVLARLQNLFTKMSNGFSALEHKSLNLADKLRYNRIKDSVKADLDFLNDKTAEKDTPTPIKDNVR